MAGSLVLSLLSTVLFLSLARSQNLTVSTDITEVVFFQGLFISWSGDTNATTWDIFVQQKDETFGDGLNTQIRGKVICPPEPSEIGAGLDQVVSGWPKC